MEHAGITQVEARNRRCLRSLMEACGFRSYECEWWHYTLEDEPYPGHLLRFSHHRMRCLTLSWRPIWAVSWSGPMSASTGRASTRGRSGPGSSTRPSWPSATATPSSRQRSRRARRPTSPRRSRSAGRPSVSATPPPRCCASGRWPAVGSAARSASPGRWARPPPRTSWPAVWRRRSAPPRASVPSTTSWASR